MEQILNIKNLKNYNEEVLRENTKREEVYTSSYETSNNDREILELQEDVYAVPSPLSFVPTCKIDRSARLMFSFPKGLLKKLKRS